MMLPDFEPRTTTLRGSHVILEPLTLAHAADLYAAGQDEATWAYMPRPALRSVEDAESMIRQAQVETEAGREAAFAIVSAATGKAVGSTRFLDLQRPHRALEIGWTWIGPPWQRTAINTECKLLLLGYAFEGLGAHRVTLKTDARNVRSQRAIERLGAVREGVLRRHRVCWDGFVRDTVYYGIVDAEWPGVKARLAAMLTASRR
jgi:RimJ/RimL family protein N-acetyltransferase